MLRRATPLVGLPQRLAITSRLSKSQLAHLSTRSTPTPTSSSFLPSPHATVLPRIGPLALRTQFSTKPPVQPNTIDKKLEKELGKQKMEARPDVVSSQSSVRHVIESGQAPVKTDQDFLKDLKGDLDNVKDTLALQSVPRESFALGLAGTLPYMGTSFATCYLAWDLSTTWPTGSVILNSLMISHETAAHWLQLLEPIQVGYGAVIISFLGAIHWGLEYAEKEPSPKRTRFRYGLGVIAPAVAWPTTFMPIEWALTSQFLSFTFLYLADARATTWGWTPTWYGPYRFVLSAIVGAAIVISLIARAKIGESKTRLKTSDLHDLMDQRSNPNQKFRNWAKEEEEERERIRREKEKEEKKKKEQERKKKREEKKKEQKGNGDEKEGKQPKGNPREVDDSTDSKKEDVEE
ncbi:hypothetical protein B0H63DRAFT_473805 [Podospora didyma]|uniref:Mitochondrial inner membrane protein 1 n=1 Tax=Podospora didyma TaxID=330526 RepID=A0AAE0NQX9_9PEZI|nr:hypothetical protein B0H63DRAFT_473805 [Podospora didyma]